MADTELVIKGKNANLVLHLTAENLAPEDERSIYEAAALLCTGIDAALVDPDFVTHRLKMFVHLLQSACGFIQIPLVKEADASSDDAQPPAPRRRRRFFQSWL